jgi:thiamine biosynthesis lipoprotein
MNRLLLGTLVEITIAPNDESAKDAAQAVVDEISRVEDLTSFHKSSGLADVNKGAGDGPFKPDAELLALIARGIQIASDTSGAFDPTVGPLCKLWQFSAGDPRRPTRPEIAEALSHVGWSRVRMDAAAGTITLPDRSMALDLGGIAKGYALDRAAAILKKRGIQRALVNAGGDILVLGKREVGRPWRIGVQHPRATGSMAAVAGLKDCVVVTSGDYERCFFNDGKRYHHILDPRTGYPAEGLQSVTIIAADGVTADALATAVFVLGPDAGMRLVESRPGVEALLIDAQGNFMMTPGAKRVIEAGR